jgi:2-polyprenyl-3-methyl-5-hydroxy-6-metoxy-1,4-benzoquinol methylase
METIGPEELAAHYEQEALPEYREQFTAPSRTAPRVAEGRLDRIEARRTTGRGSLLDVGCGFGSFLDVAQARGWQTWGVELIEEGRRRSRARLGHARVHGALADLPVDVRFDVACLWDVLEHVPEPATFLGELHDRLAARGLLALSTVNAACWNLKILGDRWPYFTPPRHLVYFTRSSLTAALERVGFRVLHVQTRFMWHALWHPLGLTGGGVAGHG